MVGKSGRLVSLRTRVKEFDAMVADGEFGQCRENRILLRRASGSLFTCLEDHRNGILGVRPATPPAGPHPHLRFVGEQGEHGSSGGTNLDCGLLQPF